MTFFLRVGIDNPAFINEFNKAFQIQNVECVVKWFIFLVNFVCLKNIHKCERYELWYKWQSVAFLMPLSIQNKKTFDRLCIGNYEPPSVFLFRTLVYLSTEGTDRVFSENCLKWGFHQKESYHKSWPETYTYNTHDCSNGFFNDKVDEEDALWNFYPEKAFKFSVAYYRRL